MGGGFIGGDGSVQWEIFGENVGANHTTQGHKSSGCRQTGVDQTPGGTQFFEVVLDKAAVEQKGPTGYRKFRLKIRPHKPKQIRSVLAEQRAVVSGDAEPGHEEADVGPALRGTDRRNQTTRTDICQNKEALNRLGLLGGNSIRRRRDGWRIYRRRWQCGVGYLR